jgi:arylsulfatase A-like enzyme
MALAVIAASRSSATFAAAPPNVMVIVADDLGFSDLGCHGGEIDTPNLDRLAAGGLRYTQAYNTARCWPSRAALLTGYYAQAVRRDAMAGVQGGVKGTRPSWAKLLPELLLNAGYRGYHSGKWHVDGDPLAQGFHRSLVVSAAGESNYFDPSGVMGSPSPRTGGDYYATSAIGDHTVACLAEHARHHAAAPFFHYVAFTSPHFPLQAPADLIAKYRHRYRVGWDVIRDARITRLKQLGIVTMAASAIERDVGPPAPFPEAMKRLGAGEVDRPIEWSALTAAQREFQADKMAIHAAMVEAMDREIGRIVAQIEAMNALDDTLVLFLSDNGASAEILIRGEGHDPEASPGSRKTFLCLGPGWASACNAPFRRHKMWVHEGGIATPWIVHWPRGVSARGGLRHQPVHVVDIVPTILELAGASLPREHETELVPPLHGRSFAASFADPEAKPAHDALWWCHQGHRAIRVGEWKLVSLKGGAWELYDLAADRCETKDLAAEQPSRVGALDAEWTRIATECQTLASTAGGAPAGLPLEPIFNGRDLEGWTVSGGSCWRVEDGVLVGENDAALTGSMLHTTKPYGDVVVEADCRFSGEIDSGIMVRKPQLQVQIGVSRLLKRDMTGSFYSGGYPKEARAPEAVKLLRADDWNRIRLEAKGNTFTVWLNGRQVSQYTNPKFADPGPIGLQIHKGLPMKVQFRKIRVLVP